MVVENTRDLAAYEKTGQYNGVYHVLHGAISPMVGIGPEDIKLKELIARLQGDVEEVIIACLLYTSEKIPKEERDRVWLVADGSKIMWVVGYRQSQDYQITEHTKNILEITFYGGKEDGRER